MIYKLVPARVSINFTDSILNDKGVRKHFNIKIEDTGGDEYLISFNECDEALIGVIKAGLRDFEKWVSVGKMPKPDKKFFTKVEEGNSKYNSKIDEDMAYK